MRPAYKDWRYHLKVAIWGALVGIALLAVGVTFQGNWAEFLHNWRVPLGYSAAFGVIWGLAFFEVLVVPLSALGPVLRRYPKPVNYILTAMAGIALGGSAAALASFTSASMPGVKITFPLPVMAVIILDAALAAAIAIVMAMFATAHARQAELGASAMQMQAQVLQAQINPHFFFNTLNTINSMVESQPAVAKDLIARLSDLFRYTLASAQAPMTEIAQEFVFIENYLTIERARYGERLRIRLPDPDSLPAVKLPGLILQPLIENAVRYGVAPCVDGGEVEVTVEERGQTIDIITRNTVCEEMMPRDLSPEVVFKPGHALAITLNRLRFVYGPPSNFRIERENGRWVRVTLTIPRRTA